MSSLPGKHDFAYVEWPRAFPHPWAQTRRSGQGFLVEVNDGVMLPGDEAPCTRRAFPGRPGKYPMPDESDPRFETAGYPAFPGESFTSIEGAEVIWSWIKHTALADDVAVAMRHFSRKDRDKLGGGHL
jgi:hypothetical protein